MVAREPGVVTRICFCVGLGGLWPLGGEMTPRDVLYKKPRVAKLPLRRARQEGYATGARLAEFGVTGASSSPCPFPHCSNPNSNIPILKDHFEEHQVISLPRGLTSLSLALSIRKERIFPATLLLFYLPPDMVQRQRIKQDHLKCTT